MITTSFFEENDKHLAVEKGIAEVYTKQPLRTQCKNCNTSLKEGFDFVEVDGDHKGIVFGVKYKLIKTIQQYEVTSKYGVNDEPTYVEISPSNRSGSCFMGEIKEFEQVYLEKYGEEYIPDES